jgi:site-specific DNA-methyltransferase (adenine-specific)/site-specific DNA-methyltransferase (cytosine-N4-specific)
MGIDDNYLNTIFCGDCIDILCSIPSNSIDLIMTSPPYADARKKVYGGVSTDEYTDWFLPRSEELYRVLKPTGTFILNIKERAVKGERSTYVIKLILALKDQGWLWTEDYIWYKKNCYPGKWPNRFRDAWEHCLQFNKNRKFAMYQDAVKVPIGDWAGKRLAGLIVTDENHHRTESQTGSGFGRDVLNWVGKDMVYPSNVLELATECRNKNHSAAFPEKLPEWFIKLFTKEEDIVLDPFMGSGTTVYVAKKMNRKYIGIDVLSKYCSIATRRLDSIN